MIVFLDGGDGSFLTLFLGCFRTLEIYIFSFCYFFFEFLASNQLFLVYDPSLFFLLKFLLFSSVILMKNSLLYKFAPIDRNLFGCSSKGGPIPRLEYRDCFCLASLHYLVHECGDGDVTQLIRGGGLDIWFPGNVSHLQYWKVSMIKVWRRNYSGKVTFSFDLLFLQHLYELIWDSELVCGLEDSIAG
jgi:hypothetical protein